MAKIKVLSVDDSELVQKEIKEFLSGHDHDFLTASDGEEGIQLVKDNLDATLLIVDFEMPKRTGLEMLKELKGSVKDPLPPVVFLTTKPNREYSKEAKELGVISWIIKPMKKPMLDLLIKKLT